MSDPRLQEDLEMILRAMPSYLDIVIMICMFLNTQFRVGETKKRITCKNILAVVQFSQNLMQQGWVNKDPFS